MFVSRDRYTHELEYMRADKWKCPDTVCGVKVSPEQKAAFEAGKPVKMENLQFKDGTKRSAYLQVSAVERGLEFLGLPSSSCSRGSSPHSSRSQD